MIIVCNNCNKSFDIDSSLIPEKGRLLQCNGCDHKWFFRKEIANEPLQVVKINKSTEVPKSSEEEMELFKKVIAPVEREDFKTIELLDKTTNDISAIEEIHLKDKAKKKEVTKDNVNLRINKSKNRTINNINILGLIIVFIISFIALILVLDTFQKPLSTVIPNIEFLLYNLYETINDILLFISDLI